MQKNINSKYILITGNMYLSTSKSVVACKNESYKKNYSLLIKDNIIEKVLKIQDMKEYLIKEDININNKDIIYNEIILANNQILIPGFIDSHIHPFAGELQNSMSCSITGLCLKRSLIKIKEYINNHPEKSWYFISGYNEDIFSQSNHIKHKYTILDSISSNKPISVMRYDCHALWVNQKAIDLAGVNISTLDPIGGKLERNSDNSLTGIFYDSAINLINKVMPKVSKQERLDVLFKAMLRLSSVGITTFMDACVKDNTMTNAYKELYNIIEDNTFSNYLFKLPRCCLAFSPQKFSVIPELVDNINQDIYNKNIDNIRDNILSKININNKENTSNFVKSILLSLNLYFSKNHNLLSSSISNKKITLNFVKLFIDGVYESNTAYSSKSYNSCMCNNPNYGQSSFTEEELSIVINYIINNNLNIHCHTVGDKAISLTLDSYAKSISNIITNSTLKSRTSLAHLQLCKFSDILRMKELNIMANFTPLWFIKDSFTNKFENIVGVENLDNIYPVNHFISNDVSCCFGSDWPISSENPLYGIQTSVSHKPILFGNENKEELENEDNYYNVEYNSIHKISVNEAISLYTFQSAKMLGLEDLIGSLEEGKLADIVVLNNNIFDIDINLIHNIKVDYTIINGVIAYKR